MSLLVSEFLSFDKDNPLVNITGIVFSLGTFITLGYTLAKFLMKNLILDSFDIKLLHKNNHTAINIAKSLSSIMLIALFFLGVSWYLLFIIKQFPVLEILLLLTVVIYVGVFILCLIVFKVYDFNMKRKFKKGGNHTPNKKGVCGSFISNFYTIYSFSSTFLFLLFGTFLLVVLDAADEEIEYLLGVSFIFSLIPSVIIFLYKPRHKQRYELLEILTDPIEIVKRKLNLEYSIDNTTSVLSRKSENENIVAIKRDYEGNYSVEIYKVIEISQPTSNEPVTTSTGE